MDYYVTAALGGAPGGKAAGGGARLQGEDTALVGLHCP
jgi:hypothetical protein